MNIEPFFKNKDCQKWLKIGGGVIAAIWIIREIFMMMAFTSMFNFVKSGISNEEQSIEAKKKKSDDFLKDMSEEEGKGIDEMLAGVRSMEKKLQKFDKEFLEGIDRFEKESVAFDKRMKKSIDEQTDEVYETAHDNFKKMEEQRLKDLAEEHKQEEALAKKAKAEKERHDRESWERMRQSYYKESHQMLPDYDHHIRKTKEAG